MKYLNKYIFFARYIPGLISISPLTLLYFFLTKEFNDYEIKEYFESMHFILGISGTFVLTFFISMVVREFGSFLESKYFNKRLGVPSNYLMLFQNNKLPDQVKIKFRNRISKDFNLELHSKIEEVRNTDESLKLLAQASKILSTKYQQDIQIKEANISYGFARNVSGGLFLSLPSLIVSLAAGIILNSPVLILLSLIYGAVFILIAIFHKQWITRNAEKYAEKLYSIYFADI